MLAGFVTPFAFGPLLDFAFDEALCTKASGLATGHPVRALRVINVRLARGNSPCALVIEFTFRLFVPDQRPNDERRKYDDDEVPNLHLGCLQDVEHTVVFPTNQTTELVARWQSSRAHM
jgi:hypothetical protein